MALKQPKKAQPGRDFDPAKSNLQKDPKDWVSGDEPMTDAQASYLKTLCEQTNEQYDANLTKAHASQRIDALKEKLGQNGSRRK